MNRTKATIRHTVKGVERFQDALRRAEIDINSYFGSTDWLVSEITVYSFADWTEDPGAERESELTVEAEYIG